MSVRHLGLLVFILLFSTQLKAQSDSVQQGYEALGIVQDDWTEADFERIDYWAEYAAHPLDLNAVTLRKLQTLPFLEEGEAELIWQYKERYLHFTSVYDLTWIEGLTKERAHFLALFFYVGTPPAHQSLELLQQLGYRHKASLKKKILGVPIFRETRTTFMPNSNYRFGIRGRNLAGEPWGSPHNRFGYANYSGYAEYTATERLPLRIVVGNYAFRVGYGLIFTTSKLSFPTERSYSLSGEKDIPRGAFATQSSGTPLGIAITSRFVERLSLTLATSYRPVNATYTLQGGERYLRTVDIAGAFDTEARMRWCASTREALTLVGLKYTTSRYKLGVAALYDYFSHPFLPTQTLQDKPQTELKSKGMARMGFYGMYRWAKIRIWGECVYTSAREHAHNGGAFTGLLASEYRTQRCGVFAAELYYYGLGNVARYQQNYSRTSHPRDRIGGNLYYSYWLTRSAKISVAYRLSQDLWERIRFSLPQNHEFVCLGEWETLHQQTLQLRYKYRHRVKAHTSQDGEELSTFRHDAKIRYTIPLGNTFSLVSQMQLVWASRKASQQFARPGGAFFQDIRYANRVFASTLRMAFFLLKETNAALYFGEPALRYTFPLHSMRNSGARLSVLFSARVVTWLRLGIQIGSTFESEKAGLRYSDCDARMQCTLSF